MIPDQDGDELEMWRKVIEIDGSISGLSGLFKELKGITREICGKVSPENKVEITKMLNDEKLRVKAEADQEKLDKKLNKEKRDAEK